MGLQLVEQGLELPPLGVQCGEFWSRCPRRVEDRRDEPVGGLLGLAAARVVDLVGDHPDAEYLLLAPLVVFDDELGAVLAVTEALEHRQHR